MTGHSSTLQDIKYYKTVYIICSNRCYPPGGQLERLVVPNITIPDPKVYRIYYSPPPPVFSLPLLFFMSCVRGGGACLMLLNLSNMMCSPSPRLGSLCPRNEPLLSYSYPNFSFTVEGECKEGTKARTGTINTPHGAVQVGLDLVGVMLITVHQEYCCGFCSS